MSRGIWRRIKEVALTDVAVLVKGLPHATMEEVERVLIEADFGSAAFELLDGLAGEMRRGHLKSERALREWLIERIVALSHDGTPQSDIVTARRGSPTVIMLLGVNGVGKTTVAAKLARHVQRTRQSVVLAAADTFRAGASEQLQVWATRLDVPCVVGTPGGDPAAVAFDAIEAAKARGIDVVIVDTAGRLHTHDDLMTELQKINRVIGRRCEGAPHETLLVLDGTVGQNAVQQGRTFANAVAVSGLVVTKVDGTAKGGAIIPLRRELGVPVRYLGVGEEIDDLELFDPRRFAERVVGR